MKSKIEALSKAKQLSNGFTESSTIEKTNAQIQIYLRKILETFKPTWVTKLIFCFLYSTLLH